MTLNHTQKNRIERNLQRFPQRVSGKESNTKFSLTTSRVSKLAAPESHPTLSVGVSLRNIELLQLEKTTKIIMSNCQPTPAMPTDHVPQCHISAAPEHPQGQ